MTLGFLRLVSHPPKVLNGQLYTTHPFNQPHKLLKFTYTKEEGSGTGIDREGRTGDWGKIEGKGQREREKKKVRKREERVGREQKGRERHRVGRYGNIRLD